MSATCPMGLCPWGLRSCGVNGIQSVPIAWANFDVREIVNARKKEILDALFQEVWFFQCRCPRCVDPTEFGTMARQGERGAKNASLVQFILFFN